MTAAPANLVRQEPSAADVATWDLSGHSVSPARLRQVGQSRLPCILAFSKSPISRTSSNTSPALVGFTEHGLDQPGAGPDLQMRILAQVLRVSDGAAAVHVWNANTGKWLRLV